MKTADALDIVASIATRWGENAEEGFTTRVTANTTDEECKSIADASGAKLDEVFEVRDLWLALETIAAISAQGGCDHFQIAPLDRVAAAEQIRRLDPAAHDGKLTTLCDIIVFG